MITVPETYSLLIKQQTAEIKQSNEEYKNQIDQLLQKLQAKNLKLKSQIYKIKLQIQERSQIQRLQLDSINKRQSLFDNDNQVMLEKQLQNAYKQIHLYQYQIKRLKQDPNNIPLEAKRSETQSIIRQKKQMLNKLKEKHLKQLKIVQENTRKLKDFNVKVIIDEQIYQLNNEVRIFKQKVGLLQRTEKYKKENMTKQYKALKKMENQLLEMGMASGSLEEIKQRAMRGIGGNSEQKQTKNIINNHVSLQPLKIPEKNMKNSINVRGNGNINSSRCLMQQFEQSIDKQNLSYENYKRQTNQLSLLDKVVSDYEKMIRQGQLQRQQAIALNQKSKTQLFQCEKEIQKLQQLLIDLKTKINPANMKPLKQLRSMTTKPKENPAKINQSPLLLKMPAINKNKSIAHLLKFDQIGFATDKGQRFTDRRILGTSNLKAKIIGARIYISKASNLIIGMQITYSGNKKGGDNVKKQLSEQFYVKQQFQCTRPNYIKNIHGSLNSESRLQSIIFVSSNRIEYKFGLLSTINSKFRFEIEQQEYPTCVFGSLILCKQNKKQMSFIEYLGIQIQKQQDRMEKK